MTVSIITMLFLIFHRCIDNCNQVLNLRFTKRVVDDVIKTNFLVLVGCIASFRDYIGLILIYKLRGSTVTVVDHCKVRSATIHSTSLSRYRDRYEEESMPASSASSAAVIPCLFRYCASSSGADITRSSRSSYSHTE